MEALTWEGLAQLLLKYGPTAVTLAERIYANIEAGKGKVQVTAADLAELNRLAELTGAAIFAKAGVQAPT